MNPARQANDNPHNPDKADKGVDALNYRYRIALLPILLLACAHICSAVSFGTLPYEAYGYQQNDWFATYGDNEAAYVNPASISEADQIEASVAAFQTLSGKAGENFVTGVLPLGYNHTLGVTFFQNGSDIDNSSASYLQNVYILSYAMRMPTTFPSGLSDKLTVGVNGTVFQYNDFDAFGGTQYSYGADVGLSYNPFTTTQYGKLLLGLSLQNLLQPSVKNEPGDPSVSIPRNVNASLYWLGWDKRLEVAASASVIDITHQGSGTGDVIVPSGGVTYYVEPWAGLKLKYTKDGYPVVGATANVENLPLFRYLQLDVDLSDDVLSDNNQGRGFLWNFRAVARFGPTREESLGDARYQRLKLEPEQAYRDAMRMYLARQFLSAAYAFGKITSKYPSFHLVDQAAYYKGKAFENSNLNQAARGVYEDALRQYTDSDLRPKFLYQLMDIDYKEGKFDEASRLYEQIVNLYPESDAKGDADYVMGQIKYSKEDYNGAIAVMTAIPASSANYPYARYTMGVSYASLGNMTAAEAAFLDVTEIKPTNASEQEIKDVAFVKLGDINFGKPQLKQAAEYYSAVSANSSKYDEALLGLAWAFLKEKNYKSASEYAQAIILKTPGSLLVPEAHLLLGYCAYFTQSYDPAIAEFDKAADAGAAKVASLQAQKSAWEVNPMTTPDFLAIEDEALELSNQLPTDRVLAKQEELRPQFDALNAKVEQYLEFEQDAGSYDRILQDENRVIKDAKFTRATVVDLKSGSGQKHNPSQQDLKDLDVQ